MNDKYTAQLRPLPWGVALTYGLQARLPSGFWHVAQQAALLDGVNLFPNSRESALST